MATKLLIGIGSVLILLGGGIYLTQQNALQMAATSFQTSVQQYASESAAVGMVITQILVALGATLIVLGMIIGLRRKIRQQAQ
jgi:hypothetical protein